MACVRSSPPSLAGRPAAGRREHRDRERRLHVDPYELRAHRRHRRKGRRRRLGAAGRERWRRGTERGWRQRVRGCLPRRRRGQGRERRPGRWRGRGRERRGGLRGDEAGAHRRERDEGFDCGERWRGRPGPDDGRRGRRGGQGRGRARVLRCSSRTILPIDDLLISSRSVAVPVRCGCGADLTAKNALRPRELKEQVRSIHTCHDGVVEWGEPEPGFQSLPRSWSCAACGSVLCEARVHRHEC